VDPEQFDAVLLASFGGPQGPQDVMPFLRLVTAGRGVPADRLTEVAEHYLRHGGVSPITAQNEALLAALDAELLDRGFALRTYLGNRNWHPFLADTARQMYSDGVRNALVIATSSAASYSGCRQYREDLALLATDLGEDVPRFTKVRHYFDHPGFVRANADAVSAALSRLPGEVRDSARLVFTAHSIPVSMNDTSGPRGGLYSEQQHETARLVTESVRGPGGRFDLVWQSRSGPPRVPWLEPDINDHLRALATDGVTDVVVSPTGFISDHMEVVWDLDEEAAQTAEQNGMRMVRAATAGTHPAFVAALADLVGEYVNDEQPKMLSSFGVCGVDCPATCCPPPRRHG
jgi:ferrochelatase